MSTPQAGSNPGPRSGANPGPARARSSTPPPRAGGDPSLEDRIKAYPGTLTFRDLIRKNKRDSVFLIVCMLLLAAFVGAAIGTAIGVYGGAQAIEQMLPSALIGLGAALIAGVIGALWSWFGGAQAVLRMSGAREIVKEDDPQLFNVVDEMRIAAGLPMPKVYIIETKALNAFATGRDPEHGVVAITRGLRDILPRDELQAVIAHEMAHIRHLDIRFAMLMATMVGLIVFAADVFMRMTFRGALLGRGGRSSGGGGKGAGIAMVVMFVIAILLAIIAPIFARIIQMAYSRRREYLADAGAVELTRDPGAMARALQRLAGDPSPTFETASRDTAHMFIVNPLMKTTKKRMEFNSLFASHPPIKERMARLLALLR